MKIQHCCAAIALFVGTLTVSSLSNAALVSRLNGQAVYDTDLNITWLADSNLAASNTFNVAGITNGDMDWNTAQSWIGAMNVANYLGFSDWRLPTTLAPDPTCGGPSTLGWGVIDCTGSELGHLFYTEQASTSGLFITTHDYYWSGTECGSNCAYAFFWGGPGGGAQGSLTKDLNPHPASQVLAWAVRSGDVAAVPLPAAFWLFGSGLLGLMRVAHKCKAV